MNTKISDAVASLSQSLLFAQDFRAEDVQAVVDYLTATGTQAGEAKVAAVLTHHASAQSQVEMTAAGVGLGVGRHELYAAPVLVIDPSHIQVIESLLQVAYAAWKLADDTEDSGRFLTVPRSVFDALSTALDQLDELPDDQPGCAMECAAKARWALRGLIDGQRAAGPSS